MLLKEFLPLMRKQDEKLTVIFCFICNKRSLKKTHAPKNWTNMFTTSIRMDELERRTNLIAPQKNILDWYPLQP